MSADSLVPGPMVVSRMSADRSTAAQPSVAAQQVDGAADVATPTAASHSHTHRVSDVIQFI